MEEAVARLRSGESDVGRIADLTAVPAALVELMKDTATAEAGPPSAPGDAPSRRSAPSRRGRSMRLLVTVALLSISAIECSLAAVATGRLMIGQLGAVAAVLALLVAQLGCAPAGRPPRR